MKKIIDTIKNAVTKSGDTVSELLDSGLTIVSTRIGKLPFIASHEAVNTPNATRYDEKHYFLVPFRLSETGYTFYSMRVLPESVPPINNLPKRRIFHFPNEHGEQLMVAMLQAQVREEYTEVQRPQGDTLGNRLVDIANEIDKVDSKVTNGMLLIGGLVALVNPLIGAGIAAKALIPGVGAALYKYGLRNLGEKWNENQLKEEIQNAERKVLNEFKGSDTCHILNPILSQLELALNTEKFEYGPSALGIFSGAAFDHDGIRMMQLTCTAISNTYQDLIKNKKLCRQAALNQTHIQLLMVAAEAANRKTPTPLNSLRLRMALLATRLADDPYGIMLSLKNIETHLSFLLNEKESLTEGFDTQTYDVRQIASEYLPQSIDNYLALSAQAAKSQILNNGKSAEENFAEQIYLLENTLEEIVGSIHKKDAQTLLIQGRFLKDKFAQFKQNFIEE